MLAPAASIVFAALLGALVVFQLALIAGAPLGHLAWGGQDRVLTARKRVGSVIGIVLYASFALVALLRSGVVGGASENLVVVIAMWVITGYLALGIVLNAISRSKPERFVMTPFVLVLAILALVVALGR